MIKTSVVKGLISVMALFFLIGCTAKEHVPIPSFSEATIDAEIDQHGAAQRGFRVHDQVGRPNVVVQDAV